MILLQHHYCSFLRVAHMIASRENLPWLIKKTVQSEDL
jgi:hypothetical protein